MSKTVSYKQYYSRYKKNVKGGPQKYQLTPLEFHNALRVLNQQLRDYAIETGETIVLPYKLGSLTVCRQKYVLPVNDDGTINYDKMRINWYLTSKLWKDRPELKGFKFIYHINKNGIIYRIEWKKTMSKYKSTKTYNYPWYTIKNYQTFNRRISHYVMNEPHKLWATEVVTQNQNRPKKTNDNAQR